MQGRKPGAAFAQRMNTRPTNLYVRGDSMETFVQILKDFGFPVACVVALFWLLQREQENHKQETASLTSAITELRVVLAKILAKIGGDDK